MQSSGNHPGLQKEGNAAFQIFFLGRDIRDHTDGH